MNASPTSKLITPNRWFSLTYRCENELNDCYHDAIKLMISKYLVDEFNLREIHSYLHSNLVFRIDTSNAAVTFRGIRNILNEQLVIESQRLQYSLNLIAKNNYNEHFVFFTGTNDTDRKFQKLISEFFPHAFPVYTGDLVLA